jgi:2-methylcitrate dehydratase
MDATTNQLIKFASRATFARLSQDTVHECKRRLIDSLGCALGFYNEPLSAMARAVAFRSAPSKGAAGAKVWGSNDLVTPESAAFANGVMIRLSELSDMYAAKGAGHPSDVLSGIFAVGEAVHANGESVIAAATLAYDVYCSLYESINLSALGWDQPICVSIASALGIGTLLQLPERQLADAVALALAPSMALYQTRRGEISSWKGAATANASRNAVFAAFLAKDGFSGPTAIFDGECGFRDVIGAFDLRLDAGEKTPHRVTQTNMKSFPICYHGQSAVWAALELQQEGAPLDAIISIEIETYDAAIKLMANDPSRWTPTTPDTADHSLPYVVAVALLDGKLNGSSFLAERLQDSKIAALSSKVKVRENPEFSTRYPVESSSRVTLRLSSGESRAREIRQPKGHISNPLSDSELERKFRDLFRNYGGDAKCDRVLQTLWRFEKSSDVSEISNALLR